MIDNIQRIHELVRELNYYRNAYYNNNSSLITDAEYDKKFDELAELEKNTGFILNNSPTQQVGFMVQDKFNKVKHDHPMLSLDKVKDVKELIKFLDGKDICASLKMDGLTLSLSYDKDGNLIKAETRGDGFVGEDVLNNAKFIDNIPLKINNHSLPLVIDGEVIVKQNIFEEKNKSLPFSEQFSHPRNYASGSLRQQNTEITKDRCLTFIPWKVVNGYNGRHNYYTRRLFYLSTLGFNIVPYTYFNLARYDEVDREEILLQIIEMLKNKAEELNYPIDGLVFAYDDIEYGEKLGVTSHHPLHSKAFKFENEEKQTVLRKIEFNVGKTGMVAPTAVFDPVDLDGAIISRASLFNLSVIENLALGIGDTITIIRSNQVIPKVEKNLTKSNTYVPPTVCPSCGTPLEVRQDGKAKMLWCINSDCPAKNLSRFTQFVSKYGMNIDGLSEAILTRLIDKGYVKTFRDIFELNKYKNEIVKMEGFGEKSCSKLIDSIESAKSTTLENVLVGLSIPNIGKTAAKSISHEMHGSWKEFMEAISNSFDFTTIKDFGEIMNNSIYKFFNDPHEIKLMDGFYNVLLFKTISEEKEEGFFTNKRFCITGSFSVARDLLKEKIEKQGGIFVSGVSKKLDVLVAGDKAGSKLEKAKELQILIVNEEKLKEYISY